jgi:hypothetical protein
MTLVLREEEIADRRWGLKQRVGNLCHPSLFGQRKRVPAQMVSVAKKLVLAATTSDLFSDVRNQRLQTNFNDLYFNYFEEWQQQPDQRYLLLKMYLHIDQLDSVAGNFREVFALHCDPQANPNMPHHELKRIPHIHMTGWNELKKAHVGVALGHSGTIVTKIAKLDAIFEKAASMVAEQVLPLIAKQ